MIVSRRRLRIDALEDRAVPATLSTFLTTEHLDLGIGYTRASDTWTLNLHDADAGATHAPADALMYAGPPTKETRPAAAAFAFLGVGPGADYYRLPESQAVNRLYAGFAATGVTSSEFNRYNPLAESKDRVGGVGRWLKVSLAKVTHTTQAGAAGAGQFAVWQSGDTAPKVLMASHDDGVANPDGAGLDATDGVTADDAVWVLAGSHSHYNFGFSEPGRYEVKVKLSGNVNTDGNPDTLEAVSQGAEVTLYFSVASVGQLSLEEAPQAPEGGGPKTVTVTRAGGSDGRITVNYATANGTAAAPGDYTAASGTLTFNDGETSKTFVVSVVDDAADEPDETVALKLSSPGPASIDNYLKDHEGDANGLLGLTPTTVLTILDDDSPPTISDVADQTINEDTPTAALPVTVGDAQTPAANLTLSAVSSNPALIPTGNVVLGGSGANRTVTVTPAGNQSGTATITLTVTDDGGLTATDTFVVTVNAVNDSPTVSDVANQIVDEDTLLGPIAVSVGDVETAAAGLTLTAASSDQALIPDGNIVIGGSGANRTVSVTSVANASGTATVTLTVTDDTGGTASDTFTVTVNPVNDAPTVSDVGNQTIDEDSATTALAVTVGDAETDAAGLTLTATSSDQTLVSDGNIVIGGSGASRTVTVTPAENRSGVATITLTVTDAGGQTATDTFTVTVNPVNDIPTISETGDQTVDEDTPTSALPVVVGDMETSAGSLTVTAVSSDQALIPDGNINIGGSGANRTVTVAPAANMSGTTTITLTVTDAGGLTATDTFVVTVNAVNDAPTVSDVTDQTSPLDTPLGPVPFVVADADHPAAGLTVTAASSDQTLIPDGNISLGGSGGSRTLTLTPVAGRTGTATITLRVTDAAGATAVDTFTVAVGVTPPTVSDVADQTTSEDTPTAAIPFTVGDAETPAGALIVIASSSDQTLVPDGNIAIGGIGANRTVSATPAANRSGSATITLTVTDPDGLTVTDTFLITVAAVNDAPTLSAVPGQMVKEDEPTPALAVTLGDVETLAAGLALSAASSNPTLVPVGNVAFGGIGANRTVTVTPAAGQFGVATVTVTVTDADGGTAEQSFSVTVIDQAAPVASADAVVVSPGNKVLGNLLANDADADGDALTAAVVTAPLRGSVFVAADGSFAYTPGPTFAGSDTFQYTATDATGRTATGTVTVGAAGAQDFEAVLTEGHADVGVAYGNGAWDLHIHDGEADTEYEPAGALLSVGPAALTPRPAGAAFDFLGVAAGENYYRLPQTETPGLVFLGFGTEEIPAGTFAGGTVSLTLKAVNGPGHFSVWKSDINGPAVRMATTDGVTADDALTLTEGSHAHYNLGFSAKGRYEVTFEATGNLTNGLEPTASGGVTYYFSVDSLGRIAFDPVTYGVKEGGTTTLTVRRTGGSDGPATVAYTAVPQTPINGRPVAGKASATDFSLTPGTLAFADGETVKTITFTAKTDRLAEPVETVPVSLTVPADSFAQLGSAATATVAIDTTTALRVLSMRVNDGLAQRSNVETVAIRFSRDTNVPALIASGQIAAAVKLFNTTTQTFVNLADLPAGRFHYALATNTLTIGLTTAGLALDNKTMLADGRHELRLDTGLVTSAAGTVRLTDNDKVKTDNVLRAEFHRLEGDFNGDRKVNSTDVTLLNARLNSFVWQRKYLYAFDLSGPLSSPDGVIDLTDMTRLKTTLFNRKLL